MSCCLDQLIIRISLSKQVVNFELYVRTNGRPWELRSKGLHITSWLWYLAHILGLSDGPVLLRLMFLRTISSLPPLTSPLTELSVLLNSQRNWSQIMMQMLHAASHLLDPSHGGAAVLPLYNYICLCHIFFKTKYYLILCTLAEKPPRGKKSNSGHGHMNAPEILQWSVSYLK